MPLNQLEQTVGFHITGRVQRVGFRWWTCRMARQLGLSGTVRNLADGSVEVHVRGSTEVIKLLREHLQEGPPGAVVDSIQTILIDDSLPDGFRVLS